MRKDSMTVAGWQGKDNQISNEYRGKAAGGNTMGDSSRPIFASGQSRPVRRVLSGHAKGSWQRIRFRKAAFPKRGSSMEDKPEIILKKGKTILRSRPFRLVPNSHREWQPADIPAAS
jgi:hypothetical protein